MQKQAVSPEFILSMSAPNKRVLELFEFYAAMEEVFEPERAIKLYAKTNLTWNGFEYTRHVVSRSGAKRHLARDVNTVTVNFGTNSEELVRFITNYRIEGMTLQIRRVNLDLPAESIIVFSGRCDKPDDQGGTIQVRQDIGGGDTQIPRKKLAPKCQVPKFKGHECRGGKPLSEHSPAYQAAIDCNRTWNQCESYSNTENNQSFNFLAFAGTFSYSVTETKRFLLFFQKKKTRTVSATWSSVSDLSEDTVIPEVGGVVQMELVPLMHADTGANLRTLQAVAEGEIDGIFEVRQKEKKYLPILSNYAEALGKLGSQGQPSSTLFVGAGKFSGTAWVEFELTGSDPADANDESPSTVAIVRGRIMDIPDASGLFTQKAWTDSGPLMVRYYLTTLGRHPASQIDDESILQAFKDCNEPVIDDTGFEQAIIPKQLTGGVDFKSFASASGFGAATVDRIALMMAQGKTITGGYGQLVQAYYRYINQTQPDQFISPVRKVRRRYTTNFALKEQTRLRDFIYDVLLPSFNGYLIRNSRGQIQVKVDKPVPTSYLLDPTLAGATSIHVEDVAQFKPLLNELLLVGSHLKQAEVRRLKEWNYSSFGNALPIVVVAGGGFTATLSSATLTGASGPTPASATITLGGSATAGATLSLSIDGIVLQHTAQAGDDVEATAGFLAATINGHPVLKRYIRAEWNSASGTLLRIFCKAGNLVLDAPLVNEHSPFEEAIHIRAAFGGAGQQKILSDTFKWPLASRQSSLNRFEGKFKSAVNDWATIPIWRDYEEHQDAIHAVNSEEINLSAVDNAHQAARLLKIYGGKRRLCDWFCGFSSTGFATLLDVGDVICVSHWSGHGELVNVPVIIEEITDNENGSVELVARLYRSEIYDDRVNEISPVLLLPLQTGGADNSSGTPPDNTGGTTGTGGSGAGGGIVYPDYSQGDGGYGTGGGGSSISPDRPYGL